MPTLDKKLSNLKGKVKLIKTKYNEEGKKVRIIKISRNKKKDGKAGENNDEDALNLRNILDDLRRKVNRSVMRNNFMETRNIHTQLNTYTQ